MCFGAIRVTAAVQVYPPFARADIAEVEEHDYKLFMRWWGAQAHLVQRLPSLSTNLKHSAANLADYEEVIETIRAHSNAKAIFKWHMDMERNDNKVSAWISRTPEADRASQAQATHNMHPQTRLETSAAPHIALWQPAQPPAVEAITQFTDWIPPDGYACPPIELVGEQLRKRVRKVMSTSASVDQWLARKLVLLPKGLWDLLARFWNSVVKQRLDLPSTWHQVRCCLIPKPEDPSP